MTCRQLSRAETYTVEIPVYLQQLQCCSGYTAGSDGVCERTFYAIIIIVYTDMIIIIIISVILHEKKKNSAICENCQNGGVCTHPGVCSCTAEYTGPSCETRKYFTCCYVQVTVATSSCRCINYDIMMILTMILEYSCIHASVLL